MSLTAVLKSKNQMSFAVEDDSVEPLKTSDRCDACGAQAFFIAQTEPVSLLFCHHHYRAHAEALNEQGVMVVDQSQKLYKYAKRVPDEQG